MANKYGPRIIDDGLVLCIDAAGDNKSYPIDGLDVEYLVISGGGAGGGGGGGGGAGGWILGSTQTTIASGTYPIVIGAGGTGYASNTVGTDGGISSAFGVSPSGGGGGARMYGDNARDGASGGGGNLQSAGGESVAGQGNNGGDGAQHTGSGWNVGGGGGGAGSVGMAAHVRGTNKAGSGGTGKYFGDKFSNSIGESGWLSGGGGGATQAGTQNGGLAGLGGGGYGGGNGSYVLRGPGQDGDANSGGGGGAGNEGGGVFGKAGNGGSGIVLIRYSGPPRAKGGDSIISHRGYTVHVFTSSGNFIVGETVSDLSTSKNYGTLTNMSSSDYTSGRNGYFSFDGSNQHISTGSGNSQISFGQSQSFTIEMVFSVNDYTAAQFLINRGSAPGSSNTDYTLLIESSRLIFGIGASNYTNSWAGGQTTAFNFNNTIMYLCGTVDSTGTHTGTKTLYKNGQQLTQVEYINKTAATTLATGIGSSTVHSIYYFDGLIYLTKMYNRALSSKEVLDNFNAIRGRYGI